MLTSFPTQHTCLSTCQCNQHFKQFVPTQGSVRVPKIVVRNVVANNVVPSKVVPNKVVPNKVVTNKIAPSKGQQ